MAMVAENQARNLSCSMMHDLQSPTMSNADKAVPRKLKFKITTKGIRNDSEDISHKSTTKVIVNNGQKDRVIGRGSKRGDADVLVTPSIRANSNKRKPEIPLEGQREKKQRMDRNVNLQCGNILKELMNHPGGWIFSEPVDPVKLKIPDYFSIISDPMDLGTIKRKLGGNMYSSAEEFAADVRLTFSNAIIYNPPWHEVHNCAKILDGNFCRRWKLLATKLRHNNKKADHASFDADVYKNGQDTKQIVERNMQVVEPIGLKRAPIRLKLGCRSISSEEKQKFRLELVKLSSKKKKKLQAVFHNFGLIDLDKERVYDYVNSTDDETLLKLQIEIKACLAAIDGKVEPIRMAESGFPLSGQTGQKEHCGQSSCASSNRRQSSDSAATQCSSCGCLTCNCGLKNGSAQASSSGPGVVLNEGNSPHLPIPATTAAACESWTSFNVQLSPKKALRAAMLKSRFADTIFKATHQAQLDHGDKSDPIKMQLERERLERKQREEKARIEAEIKAAEAASRRREQDLKMQRERERAAARMALIEMEKAVDVDIKNLDTWKEMEMLCGGSPSERILEELGLYMKYDDLEDEEAIMNGEEGEIL